MKLRLDEPDRALVVVLAIAVVATFLLIALALP